MFTILLRLFGFLKSGEKVVPYEMYMKIVYMTMRFNGIWKSPQKRELNLIQVIPYCIIMITGLIGITLSIYETRKDFNSSVETLLYEILMIHSFNAYLLMIYNRETINRMMATIESRLGDFEKRSMNEVTGIKHISEGSSISLTKFVTAVVCSVHVSHTIASKFYLPWSDSKSLFFAIVLPYRSESDNYYYCAFALEMAIYCLEGIINLSSITISLGFLNILCHECDIFGICLANTSDLLQGSSVKTTELEIDNKMSYCFKDFQFYNEGELIRQSKLGIKQLVEHHKYIIRLAYDVQSVLSLIVMDMFVTCEFMLCLCSFQIYQTYQTTTAASLMKNACMLSALIVHEFVYFFYGQRLVTKTANLHQSVYFSRWYDASKQFKSSLSIIHSRTSRPFVIMAGKIVPVTLASFITCLQAAFSYFNLLRALSHT